MKTNRTFFFFTILLLLVLGFSSFSKGKKKKERFPGYTPIENASYFLLHKKGAGLITPDSGSVMFTKIKFKTERDSVFIDINAASRQPSFPVRVNETRFKGDYIDVLKRLRSGDSASFFISLDSLKKYYPKDFTFDPKFDTIKYLGFVVQVDSIYSRATVDDFRAKAAAEQAQAKMKQDKLMAIMQPIHDSARAKEPMLRENDFALLSDYVKTKWKGPRNPDNEGIFYQELVAGNGPIIAPGQYVSLRYTGKYLDGTIFDSNLIFEGQELLTFRLGVDQMIEGFTACVAKMRVGTKAIFILPPRLGYKDGLTRIFEVEIISVK